ncbi:rhodanese-like domain-containing protein [uncultured Lentibacter sp.]|uniref:rhodanese-like domain-containing protein n=1 Tax=uncultured Lentibacter sp. TaxID=1659309 RepID=UPI0026208635|nr:rhodanese-like domain-containing protein [uncultured Lentibacter sp.]MCW1954308.1 rhodanese-like domain-containing protein [Roseobacter sp.]
MFAFLKALKRSDATPLLGRVAAGDMVLIDLREATELAATGRAAGALHLPLGRLAQAADPSNRARHKALSLQTPVALYCATGARSAQGVMILRKLGYREVHNLGGLSHWQAAGGQLIR